MYEDLKKVGDDFFKVEKNVEKDFKNRSKHFSEFIKSRKWHY
jgi:hypothetical protein